LCDVGLLAAQYGSGIQLKILNHESSMNFGSVYENFAAQELLANGHTLYFYNSKKYGELDFVIEQDGKVLPIEIKSGKDYDRHRAMNHVLACREYDTPEGFVFCGGNVEVKDRVIYYPIYMLTFLKKKLLPNNIAFNSDFSDINRLI